MRKALEFRKQPGFQPAHKLFCARVKLAHRFCSVTTALCRPLSCPVDNRKWRSCAIWAGWVHASRSSQRLHALGCINSQNRFCDLTPISSNLLSVSHLWRSSTVPTVFTNTTALTKTEYPPVFDGSKTIRPKPRRVTAPSNNLEFSPPLPGSSSFQDWLEEAGEPVDIDAMHVNTFERLMRTTNHNLLAMPPEAVQKGAGAKDSARCKVFLSVHDDECNSLSRADFTKACRADEVLCSLSGLFDFWNKFVLGVENSSTIEILRRKLRPRCGAC